MIHYCSRCLWYRFSSPARMFCVRIRTTIFFFVSKCLSARCVCCCLVLRINHPFPSVRPSRANHHEVLATIQEQREQQIAISMHYSIPRAAVTSPTSTAVAIPTPRLGEDESVEVDEPQVVAPMYLLPFLHFSQGTSSLDCRPSEFQVPTGHKIPSHPKELTTNRNASSPKNPGRTRAAPGRYSNDFWFIRIAL